MPTHVNGDAEAPCGRLGSWVSAVIRRVWARGGKLPPAAGRPAFDAWLQSFGHSWTDEEREELFITANELCAWEPPIVLDGVLPPLAPAEAAATFRAWIAPGTYTAAALADLYRQHSKEIGRQEIPSDVLSREMKRLPGVQKTIVTTGLRPHGSGARKERRLRTVEWIIEPLAKPATVPVDPVAKSSSRRGRKVSAVEHRLAA